VLFLIVKLWARLGFEPRTFLTPEDALPFMIFGWTYPVPYHMKLFKQ